ncbi:MAG: 30S ribosomal protein S15 [Candidatus Omnitrophica bacterium]|nr:30S ribosomal protein S15 [Candidatus Omnitrophota bacterium]MBU0878982.1 30S ribosomal protein S15 [Candidatus Omnitrophota bacterium]MBU1133834.1 30S ribosomal protein S15 [Candidatus Omnitrophota bacterium]MBU1810527.1 30S ribosomal protein S15 [Candidatus Omnitrophota bacterium]
MLNKEKKKNLIEKFKEHPKDTGSASVQIALLTERIKYLTEHLKKHKKDFHTRRGLLMLVGRRRRLLSYLKKEDSQGYDAIVKEFKLK